MMNRHDWLWNRLLLPILVAASNLSPVQAADPVVRLFEARLSVDTEISPRDAIVEDMNGDGSFGDAEAVGEITDHNEICVHDLNGDGHSDLAVTDYSSNGVSVLLGNGDGTIQTAVTYEIGEPTSGIAAGDLDGDGDADLAVSSGGQYSYSNVLMVTVSRILPQYALMAGYPSCGVQEMAYFCQPFFSGLVKLRPGWPLAT